MFGELFQVPVNICKLMNLKNFSCCITLKNIDSDEFNFESEYCLF